MDKNNKKFIGEAELIEIYQQLSKELYVYIYRFIGSPQQSDDILQDAFVNLIAYSAKKPVDMNTVKAFMYRTAHNLCVNYFKKAGKVDARPLEEDHPSVDYTLSGDIEREELNNKIYQILDGSDGLSRSIFIMNKELGLSTAEIAANIGKSERTVRRKLGRLLEYLAAELKSAGFICFAYIFCQFLGS